jgi:hypothetical protein
LQCLFNASPKLWIFENVILSKCKANYNQSRISSICYKLLYVSHYNYWLIVQGLTGERIILWIELMCVACVFNYSRKVYMSIPWRQLFKCRGNVSYTTMGVLHYRDMRITATK